MKRCKGLTAVLCVCVLGAGILSGCGRSKSEEERAPKTQDETKSEEVAQAQSPSMGYVFVTDGGIELTTDIDVSTVLDGLGEQAGYYEEPSCAVEGIAKFYSYNAYEIETYPDGDVDRIARIVFKTDNVATPEGIDLSMTKADILETYGLDYKESGTSIVYDQGEGAQLCFIMDGENIASIEYDSPILD